MYRRLSLIGLVAYSRESMYEYGIYLFICYLNNVVTLLLYKQAM